MSSLIGAVRKRRSIYSLTDNLPISNVELELLLAQLVKDCPTAFNMQSTRMVVLTSENHKRLWGLILECLEKNAPPENLGETREKLDGFAGAYGTILYFDDTEVTKQFAADYPLYENLFPDWALEQNGMLQFAVWCAFAERHVGASLQHYNPVVDTPVKEAFGLPGQWRLLAQMPFGGIASPPDSKTFQPIEKRLMFL